MNGTTLVEAITDQAKLNAKEGRLLAYLYDKGDLNIDAICCNLKTTPMSCCVNKIEIKEPYPLVPGRSISRVRLN
jgi:hypothetical protein